MYERKIAAIESMLIKNQPAEDKFYGAIQKTIDYLEEQRCSTLYLKELIANAVMTRAHITKLIEECKTTSYENKAPLLITLSTD